MKDKLHTVVTIGGNTVPAEQYSIAQSEFFQASAHGLKPQAMFKIRFAKYNGEDRLTTHDGDALAIYRTYRTGDWIELYCERRAGVR